jgi:hypothetical protein
MASVSPAVQMRLPLFPQRRCPCCGGPVARGEGLLACVICGFAHPLRPRRPVRRG